MRSRGFTLVEAASCIVIMGCLAGSLVGRKITLDKSAYQNQYAAAVSAFAVGANAARSANLMSAASNSGFVDSELLFCTSSGVAVLATFSSSTPVSVCSTLSYSGQTQGTRNNYCQSIFLGVLGTPPPIAGGSTENFPAVPAGFTGGLTSTLRSEIPNADNYPGYNWVGMDEGTDSSSTCSFFFLPAQGYNQVWILQYNRSTGDVSSSELTIFS